MILPNKYVTLSESFLGISAMILDLIGSDMSTIDELWELFDKKYRSQDNYEKYPSYTKFLLTLDFMYLTDMLNYTEKGEMYNENIKS